MVRVVMGCGGMRMDDCSMVVVVAMMMMADLCLCLFYCQVLSITCELRSVED